MTTDKQRRIALKAAKKLEEAAAALSDYWMYCVENKKTLSADDSVTVLRNDCREFSGFLENKYVNG